MVSFVQLTNRRHRYFICRQTISIKLSSGVGRQVKQERLVIDQPALAHGRIDAVMNAGVVQHDHGRSAITFGEQAVDESDHIRAFDGASMRRVDQFVRSEIECPEHAASSMRVRFDGMGQASW
ncbi:hypothetical protein WK09_21360 [Burkholderia ubonensis]|nr:hypothetical protein WK09_21360 [Burkholderia ubonensis]